LVMIKTRGEEGWDKKQKQVMKRSSIKKRGGLLNFETRETA